MELQEAVERITRDVTAAVTEVVTAAEQRLADQAQKHRDELIGQTQKHRDELIGEARKHRSELIGQTQKHRDELIGEAQKHRDELTGVIAGEITSAITAAERRLADQAQVNVEAVKSQSKLAAEGYAATLGSINRKLDDLDRKVSTKFTDHDAILKNHGDRIQALEHGDG